MDEAIQERRRAAENAIRDIIVDLRARNAVLHRALMRNIQADNECPVTGKDCLIRGGSKPCSCSLQAENAIKGAELP